MKMDENDLEAIYVAEQRDEPIKKVFQTLALNFLRTATFSVGVIASITLLFVSSIKWTKVLGIFMKRCKQTI